MEHIPVHRLQTLANTGFEIRHSSNLGLQKEGIISGAHRDDHYIFFIMQQGSALFMVDFTEINLAATSVYYILPGQVPQRIGSTDAEGWFIAVDTALIPADFRNVFENGLLLQYPQKLDDECYQQINTLATLIYQQYIGNQNSLFFRQLSQSLLNSFLAMTARCYTDQVSPAQSLSRPQIIAHEFKKLLAKNVQTIKSPAAYAGMLNISQPYLNEALKKVTGFSVTYWILHEVMLEAKRLLYYSQLNVKEIAHQLGYEDHTYFSRLFKNTNQITPLGFRELYHK